jgi:hypothetical protein
MAKIADPAQVRDLDNSDVAMFVRSHAPILPAGGRLMGRPAVSASLARTRAGIFFTLLALVPGLASAAEVRPRLDLTGWLNATRTIPAALVTPAMAQNIGPGSHLLIDIPNAGTFGCTTNFIWASGNTRYLGAAGHCFIPEGTVATHGPGAD